jgi:hypothetical protein
MYFVTTTGMATRINRYIINHFFRGVTMKHMLPFALLLAVSAASAQIHFTAALSGADEVPAVVTTATATGSFILNESRTELAFVITYQGLSGTLSAGGHFHTAKAGVNGPVVRNIALAGDPASNTISGIWKATDAIQPLTAALVESLLTGRMYVNFHTTAHAGGEIRGQVTLATALEFTVDLDGAQQVPPVTTTAGGTGVFVLSADRTTINYWLTYRGLSGTLSAGGHIHSGVAGTNGGIVKGIALSGDPASASIAGQWKTSDGTEPLTSALVDSLIAGKLYANFHTTANPGGEIRGQLNLAGGTGFAARLEASQENPPTGENGTGTGYLVLNAAHTAASYAVTYINLTGILTAGGHFHVAGPGRNGSIVKNIALSGGPASATLSGTWSASDATQLLTKALAESLLSGRIYVNFHTSAHPGGEIRGQLNLSTGVGFSVTLNGANEVPPNATTGSGSGFAVLNAERKDVKYGFTYFGLTGTLTAGGHFHTAPPGVSGGVVKLIALSGAPAATSLYGDWATTDAAQPLTDALVDSIIAGHVYVNFHTAANPGGEIRGQLQFPSGGVTAVERVSESVPVSFELHQNYPNPFNPSTTITFNIARAGRISLKVFNILGQEVATLANEVKEPGTYSVRFDAAQLSSGTYIYRLQSETGIVSMKKMMLLK